ncbi:curli assembly chaperone CsgC [Rahnella inusitata]|uniref:Curli assembly protein CsgC n=1 Tax=Rahnella inusitata TaxID=58169 RepID=A0ABX9P3Z3_9GAMM|nr:curli assembly chaperone CsgC [Rahnella inusitata]RJT15624.1 aggregative fimbriae synthesis protein [Rahnella inusitata]
MHLLLIAAVMSNQLWFDTQSDAQSYVVTPMVNLTKACACQVAVSVSQEGGAGNSTSHQSSNVNLSANQPQPLGRMRFSVTPGSKTQIMITVTDGGTLRLEKQITLPGDA